ncbi:histidine kinase [Chelativorans salis]
MSDRAFHNLRNQCLDGSDMPTLFRLLTVITILAGLFYGAMFALATLVEPNRVEMTVDVPAERLVPR